MPSSHRKVVGRPVDASYACLAEICEDCGTEWPCREGLEEENERLRAAVEAKGNSVDYVIRNAEREAGFKARIDAALAIPGKVREEMAHPLWPSLTEDDMLTLVEEMLFKALKGE